MLHWGQPPTYVGVLPAGTEWGIVGYVVGLALFPVTLLVVPFYAGIANGDWWLVGLMAGLIAAGWLYQMYGREDRTAD